MVSTSQYDQRITTYFGDAVLRAGFMPVPHLLMRHYRRLGMLNEHAMFAMQLMEITWDLAQPPHSMKQLAERMGVSLRTVQRYSEHLVELGLLVVYEQFDEGAQVENAYDLSPLFARLAEFAPEAAPRQTSRERRLRVTASGERRQPRQEDPVYPGFGAPGYSVPPARGDTPPHDMADMPLPATCDVPPGGRADTPGPVRLITPPTADSSRVKRGIKNQRKNHQERDQHGGGTRASRAGNYVLPNAISPGDTPETTPVSYSLRLGDPLGLKEVTTTRRLLDQLGLHADVAAAVTPTLAPAEAWTLAAYARGARLGPGWIATQVFDFARRQARPMRLAGRYDAVGRSLAVLDPAAAEAVLAVVDRCSPDDWEQLTADPLYAAASPEVVAAVQEVWNVMCELRISGGHGVTRRERALPEQHPPVMSTAVAMTAQIWHAVLARLRQQLPPPVCATWLQPTALLALSDELAVVGAPNVFVRDELDQRYREAIVTALVDELGRQVSLEFVIEQSAAA